MQTIPRELVDASIFSLNCCAETFFSFVKPNSSISRQGEEQQPPSLIQQQIPLTHQNSPPIQQQIPLTHQNSQPFVFNINVNTPK